MNEQDNNYALEHTFNNMDEFYSFISNGLLQWSSPYLTDFYNKYGLINQGCKCGKKKKTNAAKEAYYRIKDVEGDIVVMLKRGIPALKIVLKDGEHVIAEL